MPGADLLFLPLPYAHAARGDGAGPTRADAWRAYRMATIDAGAQVALDCEKDEL